MTDLLIRWTFGETKARQTSPQAWDMLECSLKSAGLLFPKAERIICYNNLTNDVKDIISRLARENSVNLLDASELLPSSLRNVGVKNSWWKYAPPRCAVEKYEIVMDNDLVLWKSPPTLLRGIKEQALVALTDAKGQYYGDFLEVIARSGSKLELNAGLVGMPPGFTVNLEGLKEMVHTDFFHSEQGFTAINFMNYPGKKYLIPLEEVTQLNVIVSKPEELVSRYCGGHFCGCSFGHHSFWEERYAASVKAKLSQMMPND